MKPKNEFYLKYVSSYSQKRDFRNVPLIWGEISPRGSNPQKAQLEYPRDLHTKFHRNRTSGLGDIAWTDRHTERHTHWHLSPIRPECYHSGINRTLTNNPYICISSVWSFSVPHASYSNFILILIFNFFSRAVVCDWIKYPHLQALCSWVHGKLGPWTHAWLGFILFIQMICILSGNPYNE